ncbi:hypothetical protein BD324DRAFT_648070 [Kockovaella imperatae]|uniref:Uncharacterized protein n=1 Tax=Kockovaella imperatae TaxID=4999 RepID=A0A1Y1UTA7_9TREE|nr:hypothetical protein BD324DRAFT_648070 [Kockovaella imperatae]ORX41182.1 hypothetical protein BD324DRAFT_648070 [Kockovaella imperatae]
MSAMYTSSAPMSSPCFGMTVSSSPVQHTFPSRPPLPRRLLSLQHSAPSTPKAASAYGLEPCTPYTAMSALADPPSSGNRPGLATRPGAPKRSHSFCGDTSKSTFALASANACGHLTPDKRELVAPPLERTLSSIGCKGNRSPPSQQMARPLNCAGPAMTTPPTPPDSPPDFFSATLPRITIHPGSPQRLSSPGSAGADSRPMRPGVSPHQSNLLGLSAPSRPSRPVRPSLAPLRNHSGSSIHSASSRSSSYTLATPMTPRVLSMQIPEEDVFESRPAGKVEMLRVGEHDLDDEQDMMEVDGMIGRVEDLTVVA